MTASGAKLPFKRRVIETKHRRLQGRENHKSLCFGLSHGYRSGPGIDPGPAYRWALRWLANTTEFPVISPPEPSLCSSAGGQGGFSAWLESALADWVSAERAAMRRKFGHGVGGAGVPCSGG